MMNLVKFVIPVLASLGTIAADYSPVRSYDINDIIPYRDGISARFELSSHKNNSDGALTVFLNIGDNNVGHAYVMVHDHDYGLYIFKTYAKKNGENDRIFGGLNKRTDNLSYLQMIFIDQEHRGKKLSYPLMCTTLWAIKNRANKEYVYLNDSSKIPNYYKNMGFINIGSTYYFGCIDDILKNAKCKS